MAKISVRCPSCKAGLSLNKTDENQIVTCPKCGFRSIISQFPEVITKKIFCPDCKVLLTIDPLYKGNIVCPQCKHTGDVSVYPDAPPAGKNVQAMPQAVSPKKEDHQTALPTTQLSNKNRSVRPGVLVLVEGDCSTRTVILKKGMNTIGRKATNSQSSIQLETADEFISRKHANIELIVKADDTFEHRLSDAGSVNGVYHNGEKIGKSDVIILGLNDQIRIGHTTFKFTVE
jgi:uncharacterized Zn finger protein (UPF0148 family)